VNANALLRLLLPSVLVGALPSDAVAHAGSDGSSQSYFDISMLLTTRPGDSVDNHYLAGPLGGTSIGVAASGGHVFANRILLESSVRVRAPFSSNQIAPISAITTFTTSHREVAFDGVVGFDVGPSPRIRFEPVGGLSVILGTTERTNIVRHQVAAIILFCSTEKDISSERSGW